MSTNKQQARAGLLVLKGILSEAGEEDLAKFNAALAAMREVSSQHGEYGELALSYIALEVASNADS